MRHIIKYFAFFFAALCLSLNVSAQNGKTVSGKITDENGTPVPGAMVLDKNNGKWATTLNDGTFSIEGTTISDELEITCLGYTGRTLVWDGKNPFNIKLEEESLELEETVVIGYGSVKKKDLTGAVGVLGNKVLEQQSTGLVTQSLQGTIPGLTVTRSSSMPGASASVLIRGVTTLSDTSPLILVDGMQAGGLDSINPNDIEQITVLKDAASASIYGARAAAGVILVTTKSAKEGEVNINYNGEFSVITATEKAEYLQDPINYMTMFNEYKWNDAGNPQGGDYQIYAKDYIENYFANNAKDPIEYPNFDWKNAIWKDWAPRHKHNLTLSYGNKVIKTRVSAAYENTDALYEGSNFQVFNTRIKNNLKISKHLSGDIDFAFRHRTKLSTQTTPLQAANMYPSIYLGLYPDGRIAPSKSGSNTLAVIKEGGYVNSTNDFISGKISLSWKPFEGFDITGNFTPTFSITKSKDWNKKIPYYDAYDTNLVLGYVSGHYTNDLSESRSDSRHLETQVIATYEHSFKNAHNLNVMAGYEDYSAFSESTSTTSVDMTLSNFPYLNLANPDNVTTSGSASENAYRSFFGRLMYNYKSRYYLQLNARGDGSSRFRSDCRWGFFPSASLGWVISNENFMQNVTPVSYLKLRASIGTLGNERIGNYPWQASIGFNDAIMYDTNGQLVSRMAAAQGNYAVQDISWETTWTYDVGVDATFFDNRLDFTADYYYKETRDMLLDLRIPSYLGYGDPQRNSGTMYTNGWEVKVGWKDRIGDFSYAVSANLSDALSIMGNLDGSSTKGSLLIEEGQEYCAWYGYRSSGIFQDAQQVAQAPTQLIKTLGPGDIGYIDLGGNIYVDENGVEHNDPDGMINATYDRTVLGSSLPHFVFGGNINLAWKNWSLGVLFNGVGKQMSLLAEYMVRPMAGQWLSSPAVLLNADGTRNYWSYYNTEEQNASVQFPKLCYTSAEKNNYAVSDYWLMNGAYFRIKNINIGYTLPDKAVKTIGLKGVRVYLNADDPFCFDHYLKGWDPEQGTNTYIARTFTIGADIKF